MLSENEGTRISKFLSLVLRHQPDTIGLVLDEGGWAEVNDLLVKMNKKGFAINRTMLDEVVHTNEKKRFAFNESHDKIRASQGHSLKVELGYLSQQPPDVLFHGTAARFADAILTMGLEKKSRQHVHLSKSMETAISVGKRHGKPIVFIVASGKMYLDGFQFYLSENDVWLTDHVPPKYLALSN